MITSSIFRNHLAEIDFRDESISNGRLRQSLSMRSTFLRSAHTRQQTATRASILGPLHLRSQTSVQHRWVCNAPPSCMFSFPHLSKCVKHKREPEAVTCTIDAELMPQDGQLPSFGFEAVWASTQRHTLLKVHPSELYMLYELTSVLRATLRIAITVAILDRRRPDHLVGGSFLLSCTTSLQLYTAVAMLAKTCHIQPPCIATKDAAYFLMSSLLATKRPQQRHVRGVRTHSSTPLGPLQ